MTAASNTNAPPVDLLSARRPMGWTPRRRGRRPVGPLGGPVRLPAVVDFGDLPIVVSSHNVTVAGRRTSIRLTAHMWDVLGDLAVACGASVDAVITSIDAAKRGSTPLTRAVATYLTAWLIAGRPCPSSGGEGS